LQTAPCATSTYVDNWRTWVSVITGGVLAGSGTAGGNVAINAGGTVAPGSSIGALGIGGSLTLAGTSAFEIDTDTMTADQIVGITSLIYGGTLKITNLGTTAYSSTQSWDLFDFSGGTSGLFGNDSVFGTPGDGTNLPTLTGGLNWSFNYGSGVLSIINAAVFSGSGTWVGGTTSWSSSANWVDGANVNGVPGIPSSTTDTATFSGSGSLSVSLTGVNPGVQSLTFSGTDYTLSGGSLTLAKTGTDSPEIAVIDGTTQTISSEILGTQGLLKSGSGTLVLSGTNSFTGGTTVADGTLVLNASEALADGTSLTVGDASAFLAPVVPPPAAPVSPVPEPGTLGLLAAAGLLLAVYRRRKGGRS
jgi:autotransporter-associated beta strand protein